MTDALIRTATADRVLHLTLDRPEKKNALTRAMYARLAEALNEAADDPQVRAVVISGAGGSTIEGGTGSAEAGSIGPPSAIARASVDASDAAMRSTYSV